MQHKTFVHAVTIENVQYTTVHVQFLHNLNKILFNLIKSLDK